MARLDPTARRSRTALAALSVVAAFLAVTTATAHAAPVTVDFESGVAVGAKINTQYGPPGTPAGPVFLDPYYNGLGTAGCAPPTITTANASSGTHAALLDGCQSGEIWATGATIAMGFTIQDAQLKLHASVPLNPGNAIFVTGLKADKSIAVQQSGGYFPDVDGFATINLHSFGGDDIAYIVIEIGTYGGTSVTGINKEVGVEMLTLDDFTYTPPSSPPNSSFSLGATPPSQYVTRGNSVSAALGVTWFNNPTPAASPISFETTGSTGITASVSPNPSGTGTATLTMTANSGAPIGAATVTVDGYVDKGLSSEKHASIVVNLQVEAPFTKPTHAEQVQVPPCTETEVAFYVGRGTGFTDPIDVALDTSGIDGLYIVKAGGTLLGAPATSASTPLEQSGYARFTLRTTIGDQLGKRTGFISATASAAGQNDRIDDFYTGVGWGQVTGYEDSSSGLPLSTAAEPMLLKPGSRIRVRGTGFCPGAAIDFGTTAGRTNPAQVANDGRSMLVDVPRGAVTGNVSVYAPPATNFNWLVDDGDPLEIHGYRERNGFSFQNFALKTRGVTFYDWVAAFPGSNWSVKIDVCFIVTLGQASCPLDTNVPDPYGVLVWGIFHATGKNGLCYGMAELSQRFYLGSATRSAFPSSNLNPTTWQLTGNVAPSPSLQTAIERSHIHQHSAAYYKAVLAEQQGFTSASQHAADLRAGFASALSSGAPAIATIADDSAGHAVLVTDIEDISPGKFKLYVYDPNVPYVTGEAADAGTRAANELGSFILVDAPADKWTFMNLKHQDDKVTPWSGTVSPDSLAYIPPGVSNAKSWELPGVGVLAATVIMVGSGSAQLDQVEDSKGRSLLDANGLRLDGANGIPGAGAAPPTSPGDKNGPVGILPASGTYTASAANTGGGDGGLGAVSKSIAAEANFGGGGAASTRTSAQAKDQLTINPKERSATVKPAVSGDSELTVGNRSRHLTATLDGKAGGGSADSLGLSASGEVTLAHSGPARNADLTITGSLHGLAVTWKAKLGKLVSGDRARVKVPSSASARWITIALTHRGRTSRKRARASSQGVLKVKSLKIAAQKGQKLRVALKFPRTTGATIAQGATVVVLRGRKTVAHGTIQADAKGAASWVSKMLAKGSYRVIVFASATAGSAGAGSTKTFGVERRFTIK